MGRMERKPISLVCDAIMLTLTRDPGVCDYLPLRLRSSALLTTTPNLVK